MRTLILLLIIFFQSSLLLSQNNSGKIIYEDKVNIHKGLPPEMESRKDRIPEFRSSKKYLLFNSSEAMYQNVVDTSSQEKPREFRGERGGRGHGRFGGRNQDNMYYTSFEDNQSLDKQNFFGKDFLIKGERKPFKWKITAEQKQVGKFLCQKAIHQDSTQTIIAWFTPMVPVSTGPGDFSGLPGLILHLDINDGLRTITAIDIDLRSIEEDEIKKPKGGKKVTREEFEKIREEKIKEREQEWGSRRGHFMRMHR
ncbi:MAG: GLPGLI family protein [Saprospiraceae bacterium]|nr:GLPGLI family protein [Saprospiraceae bacterium]